MTKPVDRLVDASVRCGKCGNPGVGICDCWVKLKCPKCKRTLTVERQDLDPPKTALVEIQCPECNGGDFDTPIFFDAQGNELCGDPETF